MDNLTALGDSIPTQSAMIFLFTITGLIIHDFLRSISIYCYDKYKLKKHIEGLRHSVISVDFTEVIYADYIKMYEFIDSNTDVPAMDIVAQIDEYYECINSNFWSLPVIPNIYDVLNNEKSTILDLTHCLRDILYTIGEGPYSFVIDGIPQPVISFSQIVEILIYRRICEMIDYLPGEFEDKVDKFREDFSELTGEITVLYELES